MKHNALFFIASIFLFISCIDTGNTKTFFDKKDVAGIDVSHHQGRINWKVASKYLPRNAFVYIKCTEGKTYTDPMCDIYANGAKNNGLMVGCYHYFRMTSSPEDQFKNFKKSIDRIKPQLIPMVDVESSDGYPISEVKQRLKEFLSLIKDEYGVDAIIYGTNSSYNKFCAPDFNNYILYIGRYGDKKPVITGPSHYSIWQYSEKAKIQGIEKPVDICRFHPKFNIKQILF